MKTNKTYFVYIMTNVSDNVLYIGVTNDLQRRIYEHKNKLVKGFSEKYNLSKLVYYESTANVESAIGGEKQLKNWRREWKMNLVRSKNPGFTELFIG